MAAHHGTARLLGVRGPLRTGRVGCHPGGECPHFRRPLPSHPSYRRESEPNRPHPPQVAKWQIILVCGFFEYWSEDTQYGRGGEPHYTKGGKPGMFPAFKNKIPHPVPFDLFDPFGTTKKLSEETKAKKLNIEINNGRLAMFGIMGFVAEAKVPGSVPGLSGLIKGYDGNVMAPFEANFHLGQF